MDQFEKLRSFLTNRLTEHLNSVLPHHKISEAYRYAVLPAGKMVRPIMVKAIYHDMVAKDPVQKLYEDWNDDCHHQFLASALEMHHAYTLVHDDLPCMDNDQFRRGKPSAHVAFGEDIALLVGDGLLNGSYQLLSRIKSTHLDRLLGFITKALGPKGLIQGQIIDMEASSEYKLADILRMHTLKTARLFQAAVVGSYLSGTEKVCYRTAMDMFKIGHHFGIIFQLLDDLCDVGSDFDNEHEQVVNSFILFPNEAKKELMRSFSRLDQLIEKYNLQSFSTLYRYYLSLMSKSISKYENDIQSRIKLDDFNSVIAELKIR